MKDEGVSIPIKKIVKTLPKVTLSPKSGGTKVQPMMVRPKPKGYEYKYNPNSASEPKVPALYGNYAFKLPPRPRPLDSLPGRNPMPGVRSRVSFSPPPPPGVAIGQGGPDPRVTAAQGTTQDWFQQNVANPLIERWHNAQQSFKDYVDGKRELGS